MQILHLHSGIIRHKDKAIPVNDKGQITAALPSWDPTATDPKDVQVGNNNCVHGLQYGVYVWPDTNPFANRIHSDGTATFKFSDTCIGCETIPTNNIKHDAFEECYSKCLCDKE